MKSYPLSYLIDYARKHSPFYQELYRDLPEELDFSRLPFVDQGTFWKNPRQVLTYVPKDGHVFRSGGTTGKPKLTYYAEEEWQTMCESTAFMMPQSGLQYGDRVVNLFYSGNMYASFLYSYSLFRLSPVKVQQFDVSGQVAIEVVADLILDNQINVIAGLPSMIMKVVAYARKQNYDYSFITAIYYAGEPLFEDQMAEIRHFLPNVDFRSIAYASNDGGIIGFFDTSCELNEHRVFENVCKLELLDEDTGEVITEAYRPGKVYITSLYRLLMPIIRYPAGDRAQYTEPEGIHHRKFQLLGRSEEGVRVGYATFKMEHFQRALEKANIQCQNYQFVITHEEHKDRLVIKIAEATHQDSEKLLQYLTEEVSLLKEVLATKEIHPIEIQWVTLADLSYHPVTGKLKRILDQRIKAKSE